MRVSYVLLAFMLPALFSSLITVSVSGEERSVRNMASQGNSASEFSTLISNCESGTYEVSDDDIDDGLPAFNIISSVEEYRFSAKKTVDANASNKLRANIIRGPPSFT